MSWAKIDDQLHAHRKVMRAWRANQRALGLHLLALSYCAGQLTDGFVDEEFVAEKIPGPRERERTVNALVVAGLWSHEPGGWRIHDWLDFNPSREATLAKRRKDSLRKARGRHADSARNPDGVHAVSATPVPTRPHTARDSPVVCGRATASDRALSPSPTGNGRAGIAAHVSSVLEGGVDGLTTDEGCRRPTPGRVLAVLGEASETVATTAAWEARSIAQSQNRAPDIVALFAQRLGAAL